MGTRISSRLMPTRTALRQAETRLGQCHIILWRYVSVADRVDEPNLTACLDELHLVLFGYSRR